MAFNNRLKVNQLVIATIGVTGAAPQEVHGSSVLMGPLDPGGTLAVEFVLDVTTTSLVLKVLWQYSPDNTNWVDYLGGQTYSTAAGTGSKVTTTGAIGLPTQFPAKYVRAIVRSSGATGGGIAGTDDATLKYHWLTQRPGTNA